MALIIKKTATATEGLTITDKKNVISEEIKDTQVELPAETAAAKGDEGPWCEVGFEASYTHNLGNYQSARIAVTLKVPCKHGEQDTVFDFAESWVNQKMEKLNSEISGASS
jgi:hypothetical protein